MAKTPAPFGTWPSPVTSDLIVAGTISLAGAGIDGDDLYWAEGRPKEAGRYVVVRRRPGGRPEDLVPKPFNARTRVHEYGGGSVLLEGGVLYFTNFSDQRLYRVDGGAPEAVTPEADLRYADLVLDGRRDRILCVREDHRGAGEAVNTLAAIPLDGGEQTVLAEGHDFFASPRLSPDGTRLAWLTWDHPRMPWDGTELWVAALAPDGTLGEATRVAGGPEESIFQPQWSPGGVLHFVSDRTGWWNLYRVDGDAVAPLCPIDAEFGVPQWVFHQSTYAFETEDRILCAVNRRGLWSLERLDVTAKALTPVDLPFTFFASVDTGPAGAVFVAGSSTEPVQVIHLGEGDAPDVVRQSATVEVDPEDLPVAETLTWPSAGGREAHGFLYRPRSAQFEGPGDARPPLIVFTHGGPTSATSSVLNLQIAYWTSRGIAVLDVNYGGSTGYGRAYRNLLQGRWGEVDVEDCAAGARWLADKGEVDRGRLAIRGGSAGGYTTLAALTFDDTFKVGASYYGVSDLGALARDTHKFESRYLDGLVGPWPVAKDTYEARSPIFHTDSFSCPIIFFQGLEDKVVPPDQAERMVDALREKGLPVAYVPFEGEQHGFRRAENIKRSLECELWFYGRILGFTPAGKAPDLEIENLG